ncbi:hypothetical protein K438DRAFT_1963379 [Mycena galopus ATCC 62051]|nr:hypothetical protein K438DRAFT_1963379 [Mycena galopus ATCC 62051]
MNVPPELVSEIIQGIDDGTSLKMCSLAGWAFREPAQRLLLTSLNLRTGKKGYADAMDLFQESPHVTSYFTRLSCLLPKMGKDADSAEIHALCAVLDSLSNVRYCHLIGAMDLPIPWTDLPPNLRLALAEFIRRQRFTELKIHSIDVLPTAMLASLCSVAPTLSLIDTSLDMAVIAPETQYQTSPPILLNLRLVFSPGIVKALTSPDFSLCLRNIRKLWWDPEVDTGGELISLLAPQLQHLRVQYKDQVQRVQPFSLPPMPHLESAEITLEAEWMIPVYMRLWIIVQAAPTSLREVCIAVVPWDSFLHPEALGTMEMIFVDSAAGPRVRWRLDTGSRRTTNSFGTFVAALQLRMSTLHEQGKLIVEQASAVDSDFSEWIVRRDEP